MMEAARTSETLVNFYQTTLRCNPEDAIFILTTVRTSNPTKSFIICNFIFNGEGDCLKDEI
jgi:hypothetical protein